MTLYAENSKFEDSYGQSGDDVSIIIVDDFMCVRKGLVSLFSRIPHISVLGDVSDRASAIRLAEQTRPDVIIMDIYLPCREDGFDTARQLQNSTPDSKILCLSGSQSSEDINAMLRVGASGYVSKRNGIEEILRAITVLFNGGNYFCEITASTLRNRCDHSAYLTLTQKEKEIFKSLVSGLDTGEIATVHHVSLDTVATHRRSIFKKIGVDSVPRLIWFALNEGLLEVQSRPPHVFCEPKSRFL